MSKQFVKPVRKHARHKRRLQLVSHDPNSQGIFTKEEKSNASEDIESATNL